MALPEGFTKAVYRIAEIKRYRDNPLIEALPPIMKVDDVYQKLAGKVDFDPKDCFAEDRARAHEICALIDDFFQPLSNHVQLEEKLSILIRSGYVGRNIKDGSLNRHMQNNYERMMTGETSSYRFAQAKSTAKSIAMIGCSGSGKSTTINRILSTYPQVLLHEEYNFVQLTYLRLECPAQGSLKVLCHSFFREIDKLLGTNYEARHARKRHSEAHLLSLMNQVSTQRALGILVIDEIQRLNNPNVTNEDEMLEFFVELVNIIGVPVVLVGTPKARPIFEIELQSGRRASGLGSLFWEPMRSTKQYDKEGNPMRSEWEAFTNKLWKYQWLSKREEVISEEVRDCLFDLSQGVIDIVVKLFVLAQLRAIATGLERITVKLLKAVYKQELKTVHPMLDALRRGDTELIKNYSDLQIDDIDKRLLALRQIIAEKQKQEDRKLTFNGNKTAISLYNMLLAMDCDSELLQPLVETVVQEHPEMSTRQLMPIVLDWYEKGVKLEQQQKPKPLLKVKKSQWHTLPSNDFRYQYSQSEENNLYHQLEPGKTLFDVNTWLERVG